MVRLQRETNKMNTILNLLGWFPLWVLILCGVMAYVRLSIKYIKTFLK